MTGRFGQELPLSDDHGRVIGYTGLERIGQALEPIMIRRRKAEVLTQLPSRTDQDLLALYNKAKQELSTHLQHGIRPGELSLAA